SRPGSGDHLRGGPACGPGAAARLYAHHLQRRLVGAWRIGAVGRRRRRLPVAGSCRRGLEGLGLDHHPKSPAGAAPGPRPAASWERGESEQWDAADGDFLWPGAFDAVSKDSASITIRNLQQDRLLVPGQPRRVQTEQPLVYSAQTDEVRLQNPVSGGFSYGLVIRSRDL